MRIADCGLRITTLINGAAGKTEDRWLKTENKKNIPQSAIRNPQSGAALVALLAAMTIIAFLLLAAAPNLYQQALRERELESIHRGNEVAEAILLYMIYNNGNPPKTMDDLLDGVQVRGRTKRRMILRESAAKDPLSSTGEWKLIQDNDKALQNFSRKLFDYNNGIAFQNPGHNSVPAVRQRLDAVTNRFVVNLNVELTEDTEPPGDEDDSSNLDAPFIGVASRLRTKSVLTFYGIERHDWWVFTPLYRGTGQGGLNQTLNNTGGNSNTTFPGNSNRRDRNRNR